MRTTRLVGRAMSIRFRSPPFVGGLARRARPLWTVDLWMATAILAFLAVLAIALYGPSLAPHEPIFFVVEHGSDPRPYDPGRVFPFGSDVLGRDLFSLVLAGAPWTLSVVLVSGLARVAAAALVAVVTSRWQRARLPLEWLAEIASAIPATIVALLLVKIFVRADTSLLLVIGALLVTGWAGPYRVLRAELDRLGAAPFIEGARAVGVGRWRLIWRHQLPHLAPVLALNASQQVVASLVLIAELGVLGVAVGVTRTISIEESLTRIALTQVNVAVIADPPEWGGLLAGARTIESLWTTRWLVFVPGVAFALSAMAVALVGFGIARRYSRRDVISDLGSRGAAALTIVLLALFIGASLVPERYLDAREWSRRARAELRPTTTVEHAFNQAGLVPVGDRYAVTREISSIVRTSEAIIEVGDVRIAEPFPRALKDQPDRGRTAWSFINGRAGAGGGVVEAPLVFAGRGINAADYPPAPQAVVGPRNEDFARLIRDWEYADDYEGIDVRGKVVLLVRFIGIKPTRDRGPAQYVRGPSPDESVAHAIRRGATGVIFVDPALWLYNELPATVSYGAGALDGGTNPYYRAEQFYPATSANGVPVVVVGDVEGQRLAAALGLDIGPFFAQDDRDDARYRVSPSIDLGVLARVSVPLERRIVSIANPVAETPKAAESAPRIVVWGVRRPDAAHPPVDVLAALGRLVGNTRLPFVFVDFDPAPDPALNAKIIEEALAGRPLGLVVVLDRLDGALLQFTTTNGDLIPAFDLYARRAGVSAQPTLRTARPGELDGIAPFFDVRTVLITGTVGDADARPAAAALIGYLAGRLALGAEELPQ